LHLQLQIAPALQLASIGRRLRDCTIFVAYAIDSDFFSASCTRLHAAGCDAGKGEQINMSLRARHHAELLAGLAQLPTSELLHVMDGERVITVAEASRMNSISTDTFMRRFRHLVVRVTDKRVGVKMKDALSIARPLDAQPSDAA